MEKFIRIDVIGEWRGVEHRSSLNGLADESAFENGVSCYSLRRPAMAIENLRSYWVDNCNKDVASDYEGLQVTIFEGEKLEGVGADWEDIAGCNKTTAELDAVVFMSKVLDAHEQMEDGDISEDEYEEILEGLVEAWR